MRVSRLEIFGFKSFMDQLALPINAGVSGVVGPNGCGKSNIVDALRWVLGETRARNLRGTVSEDIIFNGTEKLRPLGLTEVSITLRAQSDNFFEDLVSTASEIESIEEQAQSEVAEEIGDEPIEEVSVEPEADVDSSIIGDDSAEKVDQVENREPSKSSGHPHLRVIDGKLADPEVEHKVEKLETSSETSQGEVREESKSTGRMPSENLSIASRFSWLKAANEVQITRRLYRSGESEYFINRVACRLKDIVELLRAVGLGPRTYTIVAQGEVSRIISAKSEEKRTILEEAAGVLGFRDKIAAATRRLEETDTNVSRLDDVIKEVTRQVNSLKRQAQRARARAELKAEITRLERSLLGDRYVNLAQRKKVEVVALENSKSSESAIEAKVQKAHADEEQFRAEMMGIDMEHDSVRAKVDSLKEDLYRRQRNRQTKMSRIGELRSLQNFARSEIERTKERDATIEERIKQTEESLHGHKSEEENLSKQIGELEVHSDAELKAAAVEVSSWRDKLKQKEREVSGAKEHVIRSQSRLNSLREQIRAASPLIQLKRSVGKYTETLAGEALGVLADGLRVPDGLATAVQAVCRERAGFLVVAESQRVARQLVDQLNSGSETDVAIGLLQSGKTVDDQPSVHRFDLPKLIEKIEVLPGYELAAGRIFADVYLAESLELALIELEKNKSAKGLTVVTRDGDILSDYSFYRFRNESGLVELKARERELEAQLVSQQQELDSFVNLRDETQRSLVVAEGVQAEALRKSEERQRELKRLLQLQGNVRGRLHSEHRIVEQLKTDLLRAEQQRGQIEQRIERLKGEETECENELAALSSDEERAIEAELKELTVRSEELDRHRQSGLARLSELRNLFDGVRSELDAARGEKTRLTLELQKVEIEMSNIQQKILEDLGEQELKNIESMESGENQSLLSDEERDSQNSSLMQLRARIQREGDVDPSSIEQYDQESQRLSDLIAQKSDLEQAAVTLRKMIAKLTKISQDRFLTTFAAVNENFARLIPKLFGGGSARLELLDPANPLTSGVEIIARPPGKKLKNIELLSGGEKALCAISLIFSMFLHRPSPLCVLDEVDAPLDEANVVRFANIIKEMSSKTQFLVITHNKQTMTICDNLVGVTMAEPGASKLITVSLEEAQSAVA